MILLATTSVTVLVVLYLLFGLQCTCLLVFVICANSIIRLIHTHTQSHIHALTAMFIND